MILLLTHTGDFYTIDGVEQHLHTLGAEYRRVNTDSFPAGYALSVEPGGGLWLEAGADRLDLRRTSAVWARRLWPGVLPDNFPPEAAQASHLQCRNFFMEALGELHQAYWINSLTHGLAAESKLLQLNVARAVGLRVPPTLVTSSPSAVLEFASHFPEGLITKLLVAPVQSMQGHPDFAYTTRVDPQRNLDALDVVRWSPQIFQPYLRRRREFRVIFVAGDFFVGACRLENEELVDWRAATEADGLYWEAAELEPAVQDKISQLMARLQLVYGAVDLLQDDDAAEPYFLEVNQAGEWGWLERDLGLPIAARLARALVEHR